MSLCSVTLLIAEAEYDALRERRLLSPVTPGGTESYQPAGKVGDRIVHRGEFLTVVHDQVSEWFARMRFDEALMIVEDHDPNITEMPLIYSGTGLIFMGFPGHADLTA